MYELKIYDWISSAHYLLNYKGNCEHLHGHNWKIEVIVIGNELDKSGMLIDFKILKSILKEIIDELDHKNLNDIDSFKQNSPSSENISRYIFDLFSEKLLTYSDSVKVKKVISYESEKTSSCYYPTSNK